MKENRVWIGLSILALLLLGALGALILRGNAVETALTEPETRPTVVIDAGHGGEDGGAVAADGTEESGLNLAVAQRLDAILTLCGCRTVMLREEDVSLHDPTASTIREKKVSDIHNRVKRVNETENPRLISIHQNHFPSGKYHGSQVFYANGPLSQPWAKATQVNLKSCLDPENDRESKEISHNVYLMNHITCPAILVECGFLSNDGELQRLRDAGYQTRLALVIGGSYLQCRGEI